ncbi:hypothetical protein OPV22_004280 [Ensete ventricosum]|uniref:Uncharacterized protein n=1 Tax=Ensete ventricosum TaxID=4639 RepID=A0AAV8S3D3_ENSVE|nr:hypothetical protein OPV22_004280 [Ensete ventricosum]
MCQWISQHFESPFQVLDVGTTSDQKKLGPSHVAATPSAIAFLSPSLRCPRFLSLPSRCTRALFPAQNKSFTQPSSSLPSSSSSYHHRRWQTLSGVFEYRAQGEENRPHMMACLTKTLWNQSTGHHVGLLVWNSVPINKPTSSRERVMMMMSQAVNLSKGELPQSAEGPLILLKLRYPPVAPPPGNISARVWKRFRLPTCLNHPTADATLCTQ